MSCMIWSGVWYLPFPPAIKLTSLLSRDANIDSILKQWIQLSCYNFANCKITNPDVFWRKIHLLELLDPAAWGKCGFLSSFDWFLPTSRYNWNTAENKSLLTTRLRHLNLRGLYHHWKTSLWCTMHSDAFSKFAGHPIDRNLQRFLSEHSDRNGLCLKVFVVLSRFWSKVVFRTERFRLWFLTFYEHQETFWVFLDLYSKGKLIHSLDRLYRVWTESQFEGTLPSLKMFFIVFDFRRLDLEIGFSLIDNDQYQPWLRY